MSLSIGVKSCVKLCKSCSGGFTTDRLAQLVECRTAMRACGRAWVQAPDRTNTQGLKITEENVLPLQ